MQPIIRKNERSWAIEIISIINNVAKSYDLSFITAGGESTISIEKGHTMFPDVVLYGNKEQSVILQGWELKMPDVPIENQAFVKDAQRKALALNLNSCLIWNFTYAALYVKETGDNFVLAKFWDDTSYIKTRDDVETYRDDWEKLLKEVLLYINSYFTSGKLARASLGSFISENVITNLITRNKDDIADNLKTAATKDSIMYAYIDHWWNNVSIEYEKDESDKYKAYAKSIILNWANRILFAHLIKNTQNTALAINNISNDTYPTAANEIFKLITLKCDFYNVFMPVKYNELLSYSAWHDFVEYSCFLNESSIDKIEQETFQNILEGSIAVSKRAINGQYTTPPELANLLLRLSVKDWSDFLLDCCCGTGTIPKEAIKIKKEHISTKEAVETVWACDKQQFPLQIANISLASSDSMNLANRLFSHNALTLKLGETIKIIDPATGQLMMLELPLFGTVVSNLPFISSSNIPEDDRKAINEMSLKDQFDGKSDLYCYIASKIGDVIKPGGTLGIIVSNSYLGTSAGLKFISVLKQQYHFKQVHISNNGRWFANADVVTTILVLEKKEESDNVEANTVFWLWQKSLKDLKANPKLESTLVNSAILEQEFDASVAKMNKYSPQQIDSLLELNVNLNSLFHKVDWLLKIKDCLVPINTVFNVFRGSRRGCDALFYPKKGEHSIEAIYLKRVLKNARNVKTLVASAEDDAFICHKTIDELSQLGHSGALDWIRRFEHQNNDSGKPLTEVLKKNNAHWYEMHEKEIAELFTTMNPDKRLFFAKLDTPSFINQRLIGFTAKDNFKDIDLYHALMNSILTLFYIEASGFGRGLGALDISKNNIANCMMLNPELVSAINRNSILLAFDKVKGRQILDIKDELNDPMRLNFEHTVLKSFNLDGYFDEIKFSLLSMQACRAAAKEL